MIFVKKDTLTVVRVGPLVDATDMVTVETALTLSSGTAELYTAASSTAAQAIHANDWAHITGGVYRLSLTAANLASAGPFLVNIHPAGAVPFALHGQILDTTAYDALMTGSVLPANLTQINSDATAAANLGSSALGITTLTVQSGSTTTSIPTNLTQTANNFFVGRTLIITSGTLLGQATTITAYNGTTKYLTVEALSAAPAAAVTGVIV